MTFSTNFPSSPSTPHLHRSFELLLQVVVVVLVVGMSADAEAAAAEHAIARDASTSPTDERRR